MRKTRGAFWAVVLTIVVIGPNVRSQAQISKLDPMLQARVGQLTGQSKVVISAPDAASLSAVGLLVQQLGGTLGPLLTIINSRAATVPNVALAALANSGSVSHVALDRLIVGSLERTGSTIGATAVRQTLGLTGTGIGVAVIDSGVMAWHDDLTDPPGTGPRIRAFVDFVAGAGTAIDDNGHGTHVAGIIAGNGFDSGGARTGIAPGAHLIVLRCLDAVGRGYISNVIAALDYVVSNRIALNIRVVNLSVATYVSESIEKDPLAQATKAAADQNIIVVAAAGNAGRSSQGRPQYGGITAPGNAPWVLTVGASSHMGTVQSSDDTMAAFSSRGPTPFNRGAKPDLVAPGVGIESLSVPGSSLYASKSQYLLPGTVPTGFFPYLSLSGTSQATPVVAGTVALMLQANPALTPNSAKAILQYTAKVYPAYDRLTEGAGFLNAQGAVALARFLASPSTVPYPSDAGWSKELIWGNYRLAGGRFTSTANAWLTGVVWGNARTPNGENVVWGEYCTAMCDTQPIWAPWQTTCNDASCTQVTWGTGPSLNVVWGSRCAGTDCQPWQTWTVTSATEDAIVWGTENAEDAIVWGTEDDDAIVWGTECSDPSCQPVVWSSQ